MRSPASGGGGSPSTGRHGIRFVVCQDGQETLCASAMPSFRTIGQERKAFDALLLLLTLPVEFAYHVL